MQTGLRDLLGAEGKSIKWERPFLFFGALVVGDLISWLLINPIVKAIMAVIFLGERLSFPWRSLPSPIFWLQRIPLDLVLAFVLFGGYRLVRYGRLAVPVAAIIYASLALLFQLGIYATEAFRGQLPSTAEDIFDHLLWTGITSLLYVLCFTGVLAGVTYLIRQTWVALIAGSVGGTFLAYFVNQVAEAILRSELTLLARSWRYWIGSLDIIALLFGALVFAIVFWVGLRLTSERAPLAEGVKPRISRGFFVGTLAVSLTLSLVIPRVVLIMTVAFGQRLRLIEVLLSVVLIIFLAIFATIVFMVLVYKMWAAIQDGYARTTPGKAVGFLFIPVFSLYWVFQTFRGFAEDYNAYLARYSIDAPRLSTGLFVAFPIILLLSVIPGIDLLLAPAFYLLTLALTSKICDAVNAIPHVTVATPKPTASQSGAWND